ncbi:MAG: hypothetical protein ACKO4Q_03380 [Planctomycetota bacterium]
MLLLSLALLLPRQVAVVFAARIIHEDDHAAALEFVEDFGDRADRHSRGLLRNAPK